MANFNNLYLPVQTIDVPENNDARLIFTFQDENGNLLDVSGAAEIVFAVWDRPDGTLQFTKTLSDGDIILHGNDYQFSFWIDAADMISVRLGYHECEVTNSAGRKRTVSAGLYRHENTYIGSIE
jgi:hypothetical protein